MKIKFLLAAAVAYAVALTSCKKDDPSPSVPNTQSKKLKRLTKTEGGSTKVYDLTYDASNRVVSYKTANNSDHILFSYDNQGNLTGIEEKEDEFRNIYTYTYQNNKPVSGTFKSWKVVPGQADELIEDDQLTYTVVNNQVSRIHLEMLQTAEESDLQLTYSNNNLVKVVSEGGLSYTADFSFGTKRSAFPKVTNYVLDQAGFSLQFACNNEMKTASFDFPGTAFDQTVTNQYTYDSEGYVLTSNDGSLQMVFEYQ